MNINFVDMKKSLAILRLGMSIYSNNNECIVKKPCKLVGHSYHIACVFTENNKTCNILSIGMNKYNTNDVSIHAEVEAFNKLKSNRVSKKTKKLSSVNLMVIKTNKQFIYGNSLPCIMCLKSITKLSNIKGYKLKNIYYSDCCGNIQKKSLNELIMSNKLHISSYYISHRVSLSKWMKWKETYIKVIK